MRKFPASDKWSVTIKRHTIFTANFSQGHIFYRFAKVRRPPSRLPQLLGGLGASSCTAASLADKCFWYILLLFRNAVVLMLELPVVLGSAEVLLLTVATRPIPAVCNSFIVKLNYRIFLYFFLAVLNDKCTPTGKEHLNTSRYWGVQYVFLVSFWARVPN